MQSLSDGKSNWVYTYGCEDGSGGEWIVPQSRAQPNLNFAHDRDVRAFGNGITKCMQENQINH